MPTTLVVGTYGKPRALSKALPVTLALLGVAVSVACSLASAASTRRPDPAEVIEAPPVGLHREDGALEALVAEAPPRLYPQLIIVRPEQPVADGGRRTIVVHYTDELVQDWMIADETRIGILQRDANGLWTWRPALINAERNLAAAAVTGGEGWAAGPSWMMKPWQQRRILGAEFKPGESNVLVIHGWNGEPWDGCMLALMAGLNSSYDNVAAVAYPSALDIRENASWLRQEIERRWPDTAFDIVAFSEGGLVARAAIERQEGNAATPIRANVERLIAIATPHEGLLETVPPSMLDDTAYRQMQVNSDFLKQLARGEPPPSTAYHLIAGDTGHGDDSIVARSSALATTTLRAASRTTLRLPHSLGRVDTRGLPCDTGAYDAVAAMR